MTGKAILHPADQGPWGRKNSGGSSGGNGGGGWPPAGRGKGPNNNNDFDAWLREVKRQLDVIFGNGSGGRGIILAFGVFFLLWLASGIYQVQPGEQGVVLRFGKFDRIASSGLSYHWPAPFETVDVVNSEAIRIETIDDNSGKTSRGASTGSGEMLMLTGDENIINLSFQVQWKVRDVQDFIFNIPNQDATVRAVAESAMREVIGRTALESALTEGKSKLQDDTRKLIQDTLDRYKAGVQVLQVNLIHASFPNAVVDAARDVQAARADQERARNEAEAYANDRIPRARGEAERILQDAEGYKKEVVARAEGDAARFISVYTEYKQAEDVTRKRMYLETMEKILTGMNKMVMDNKTGAVPYLPLQGLAPRIEDKKESR